MCGIAGILGPGSGARGPEAMAKARARVEAMTELLAHRGPDDAGLESIGPVTLGHRRLSILDLSRRGRQPMSDPGGRRWIVHNGEVYNYVELREELRGLGYEFTTETDTEVLLAAYDRWGEGMLPRLNGMWAFAIWDDRERTLFGARDRFGIKPFHHARLSDGALAFASEPKAFRALPLWPPEVDEASVYHYLAGGQVNHSDRTFYRGIRSLPAAHSFSVRPGGEVRPRRWWDGRDLDPIPPGRDAEIVAAARDLLTDAVRIRLRSDVPVGTCLSGGIDSSTVVGLVAEIRAEGGVAEQHTFSACFSGGKADERPYMDHVLARTGATPHRVTPRGEDLAERLDSLVWHQDEPFPSTSIFAQHCVFRLARESGVIVTLDGQAADELLGGYDAHHGSLVLDRWRRLAWLSAFREARALGRLRNRSAGKVFRDARRQAKRRRGRGRRPASWIHPDLARFRHEDPPFRAGKPCRAGILQDHLWRDLTRTILPSLLRFADRNAMAHGVEARFPFLDHRFVELARRLHPTYLIRDGWTKWLLREVGANVLPTEVRTRRDKVAFETPEGEWFAGPLGDRLEALLLDAGGGLDRWCDVEEVARRWGAFRRGEARYHGMFWKLLNLEIWRRQLPLAVSSGP